MNWIAQKFDELKARIESHIPATNAALNDLNARVAKLEELTAEPGDKEVSDRKAPAP